MRVVEYQNSAGTPSYRWLERLAFAAAVFTALVVLLMLANFIALHRNDPIHAPALLKLTEELKANPQNEMIKEQIRDLDFLARRAFFSSQHFEQIATYLLAIGAIGTVIAFKTLQVCRERLPYPAANPPKEDLSANALWARRVISGAGLLLIGLALSLSLPWKSPLDTAARKGGPKRTKPGRGEFERNWPSFLGGASGHALQAELPTTWDGRTGQGIAWKTEIPKPGRSSPIIWNDRLFLTGADAQAREVYCVDTKTGALVWKHEVNGIQGSPKEPPEVTEDATLAAPTMVTDGTSVFAMFGTGDLIALDFQGKRLWARNLGVPENSYGHGSSLAWAEDTILVQLDQNKNGALYGISASTGETKWKTQRTFKASWASPLVTEIAGKPQVILAAAPALASYAIDSGAELWRVECLGHTEVAPSPVHGKGMLYVAADGAGVIALDAIKRSTIWKNNEATPGVSTPLVVGELLFYGLNDGGILCRNALTGEKIWEAETDDGFYSSPLLSGDRVYLIDRSGDTHIFSATNKFNLISRPALAEESAANPAVAGKSLFLRGKKHLFRIGS